MSFLTSFLSGKSSKPKGSRPLPRTSPADEYRISQTLGARNLESMPAQAAKAFQLACDPKSTLDEFVRIVEADEILSARIIRVANSVYYRRGDEAKDISNAVINIGLDELRCLLSAAMLKSLLNIKSKSREQIWGNSVATGIAARLLSPHTSISEGEAFLCGILHDVGKLILIQKMPVEYEKVVQKVYQTGTPFIEVEQELLDITHVEVGKWLAEKWNFPESVRRAITFHHNAWPSNEEILGKATSTAMLVKSADTLAHAARLGHPHRMSQLGANALDEIHKVAAQLRKSPEIILSLLPHLTRKFEDEISLYSNE
ncbi:MAG TPA: HDOD domain-containing protein [Oligoflexia bacterium]|nr:HDOD domain-containing protein [Oligoflexia bacterium]HMP48737.1 HDOD domain-containing protein [Oligoflexia bacterium]